MRILVVTSEWPSADRPHHVPFLVEQVECLRQSGIEVLVFSFRGRANPLRYAGAWRRLRADHDLRSFDLVHAHFGQSGLIALPCPAPLLVTFHGSDLQGIRSSDGRLTPLGRILPAVSRFVARRADQVVVVSGHLGALLPKGVKTAVIPCGISLEDFSPRDKSEARSELGLPQDVPLVLFVGHPGNPVKCHTLAAAAVERLERDLGCALVVLHDEPHHQVPLYMNACDVLVVTSHHEGSPTAVKEALACGLPVVSVPVGDVAERIGAVPGCHICSGRSVDEFAEKLRIALSTSGRRSPGPASVKNLDHSVITAGLLALYEQLSAQAAVRD